MKGTVAAVAAMAGVAQAAHNHNHRRAHEQLFARGTGGSMGECTPGCTTIWETFYGEPTLIQPAPEPTPTPTETECVVPTPEVEVCPTPGTYTWDATTITLTETTTVCAATTTKVGPGTHTLGGVTTVVTESTTVVCPVATQITQDGVVTSTIVLTTHVCPTPGEYTIGPIETVVTVDETVIVYPTPATYEPGTYTKTAATVTVTETGYVTVCPWEGGPQKPTPAPEPVTPAPAPEKPKAQPAVQKPSAPSGGLGGNGKDHWAITYTPYTEDKGLCKSPAEVAADIKRIKSLGFDTVRTYSTDCDTLKNVGDAVEKEGMKMMVGVFVKEAGCGYSGIHLDQVNDLVAWGKWHLVSLCVIGNEAIFQGLCNAGQLKSLIDRASATIRGAGYTGPFTTAETVDVWQRNAGTLCGSVDIAGANTHPYFNAGTAASDAGPFVRGQLDIVSDLCGKRAISLECGWPQEGKCNGKACPGVDNQHKAIGSIRQSCGEDVVFFTYGKAMWKGDSECGCEPFFNVEGAF